MAQYLAVPPAFSLRGTLRVPPSKSATNRALLIAALTDSPVEIVRPLESADITALRRCLEAMGASIVPTAEGLRVSGPLAAGPRAIVLDVADSGTAARFLCAAAAAVSGRFVLTGSRRLCERPIGELVEALRQAGAAIAYREREGFPPLDIEGGTLRSGEVRVDASRSSQYLSALLIAAVAVEGGLAVRASGAIASAPYVGTTLETLRQLGHEATADGNGALRVRRGARVASRYETPGDWSSAVPLLAAVLSAGGELTLSGLRLPSEDADARALPILERMGLSVLPEEGGLTASAPHARAISPVRVEATDFPDAVPVLAALAALAEGTSRFSGVGHLRLKESDRIAALRELLGAAGASAAAHGDALEVTGPARPMQPPVRLPTFSDHRMAMAAAVLALRRPGMLVEDPDCVAKSYPGFFRDLDTARARDNT